MITFPIRCFLFTAGTALREAAISRSIVRASTALLITLKLVDTGVKRRFRASLAQEAVAILLVVDTVDRGDGLIAIAAVKRVVLQVTRVAFTFLLRERVQVADGRLSGGQQFARF